MSCRSSFHGEIKEIPGIGVDNFNNANNRAYFLSHCHSDHTEGLFSNEFLEAVCKNEVAIYMSEVTANIIITNRKQLDKYIKRLKIGTMHITLPPLFNYEEQFITVTAIPAGHCFGSVMFLFETNKEKVLYTGDFRIKESDVSKNGLLHDNCRNPLKIDIMYVDTTFLDMKYVNFPKRSACVEQVVELIDKWLKEDGDNAVALNTPAKFGYEFLYNDIHQRLGIKVYVRDETFKFYRKYPKLVSGVTNIEENSKIHVCESRKESNNHDNCVNSHRKNFLSIRLTAMKWAEYDLEESPINRISNNKVYACFPTHCSRSELIHFVNYFSPTKICGFPNDYDEYKVSDNCFNEKRSMKRKLCS